MFLLQGVPDIPVWVEKLLFVFIVPIIAAIGYLYKRWTNRNLTKIETAGKAYELEQKLRAEVVELSSEMLKNISVVKELTQENQALGQKILDKDRRFAEDLAGELTQKAAALAKCEASDLMAHRTAQAVRRLFDKINIPYWETDAEGKGLYVNAAWHRRFKTTFETAADWINSVVEGDRARIQAQWQIQLSDTDTVTAITFGIRDGERIIKMQSVYAVVRGQNGEVVKIIGVTVEIE